MKRGGVKNFFQISAQKVCRFKINTYLCIRNREREQPNGVVVQLVRIPACHAGGRGFESRPYRKIVLKKFFGTIFFYELLKTTHFLSSCLHEALSDLQFFVETSFLALAFSWHSCLLFSTFLFITQNFKLIISFIMDIESCLFNTSVGGKFMQKSLCRLY